MARLRRADEIVVGDIEKLRHIAERLGDFVGPRERLFALGFSLTHHLLAVLVRAGEKHHVIAVKALEARQ